MLKLSHQDVFNRCADIAKTLRQVFPDKEDLKVFPVPRGGIPCAYALGEAYLANSGHVLEITDNVEECDFILDDLVDSGATKKRYDGSGKFFIALFSKDASHKDLTPDEWVVFPWEAKEFDDSSDGAEDIPTRLLQYIGEDAKRGGFKIGRAQV